MLSIQLNHFEPNFMPIKFINNMPLQIWPWIARVHSDDNTWQDEKEPMIFISFLKWLPDPWNRKWKVVNMKGTVLESPWNFPTPNVQTNSTTNSKQNKIASVHKIPQPNTATTHKFIYNHQTYYNIFAFITFIAKFF